MLAGLRAAAADMDISLAHRMLVAREGTAHMDSFGLWELVQSATKGTTVIPEMAYEDNLA